VLLKFHRYKTIYVLPAEMPLLWWRRIMGRLDGILYIRADGVGRDDEAINEALFHLPRNPGGKVYLPNGTFQISQACTPKVNNTMIEGAGPSTIIQIVANSKINAFEVYGSHVGFPPASFLEGLTFKNFVIDGNKANFTTLDADDAYWNAFWINQADDSLIENVRIKNMVYHGIVYTEGGSTHDLRNRAINNIITGCGQGAAPIGQGTANTGWGILLEAGCSYGKVRGNIVRACASHAIVVSSGTNVCSYNSIVDNTCVDNGNGSVGTGVFIADANSLHNIVAHNILMGNLGGPMVDYGTKTVKWGNLMRDDGRVSLSDAYVAPAGIRIDQLLTAWGDNFFGDSLDTKWNTLLNGGTVTILSDIAAAHSGVVRLATGAVNGQEATLNWNGLEQIDPSNGCYVIARWKGNSIVNQYFSVGLASDTGAHKVHIENLAGTTYYSIYTRDGVNDNRAWTTIPIDTSYHVWVLDVSPSSIKAYCDGVLVGTSTSNLPTDTLEARAFAGTAAAADKQLDLDYYYIIPK